MTSPRVGVLALQGDVLEHLRAVQRAGGRAVAVRRPEELAHLDAIVLPGGESTTIGKLLAAFDVFTPLQQAIAAGLPVFGSCAGMILLAEKIVGGTRDQRTLGGLDVTVRRNAFGRQVDSYEQNLQAPLLLGDNQPVQATFIRAPWVEHAGPSVQVLATVRAGAAGSRIVAVQQGMLLATAFHPELGSDNRIHQRFVDMVAAHLR